MSRLPSFAQLADSTDPTLDLMALSLAAEFRDVDASDALARLDALGGELSRAAEQTNGSPQALARACAQTLGQQHGFVGDRREYDHPDNSMLDLVLVRCRGLPILLSVLYVEVARRAGIELGAVGLPGHFVVAHFDVEPPLMLDPFAGGALLPADLPRDVLRPWRAHEIAMRMLNNLVAAFSRRGDLGSAIRAATMRMALPAAAAERDILDRELRAMQARLN